MTSEDWERYVEEMARKIAARRARLEEITVERREVDRQFERLAEERGIDLRQVRGMSVPDSATLDRASAQLLDDFQNRLRQSEMEIMAADSPGDSGGFVPGIRA